MNLTTSAFILGEFAVIVEGTFFSLSWDIMEPISYMMLLFNELVAFGWFYMFITKPSSNVSLKDHIHSKSVNK